MVKGFSRHGEPIPIAWRGGSPCQEEGFSTHGEGVLQAWGTDPHDVEEGFTMPGEPLLHAIKTGASPSLYIWVSRGSRTGHPWCPVLSAYCWW
jgi:hypothetical protein